MEMLNAIDERRYIDTWKLYEQHMQMEGFPRKSVVNRLLTGFAESLDVQWLEKAYGMVEQAFEESKQNLDHVIKSCISFAWLDQAHDLLDEMCLLGLELVLSYMPPSLKHTIESQVLQHDTQGALHLFKEMKEAKIPRGGNQEFDRLVKGCAGTGEAGLMAKLLGEIREGQKLDSEVHDWNNVIHFFYKKKLMQVAEKALAKMRSRVTKPWGEMKSLASSTSMKFDQELLGSLLYTFVRGEFFVRANEVVDTMEKGKMFTDKYKYWTLFLKYHKTLYKGKVPKIPDRIPTKEEGSSIDIQEVGWFTLRRFI
ncbi:hypothetical protein REPUB_Repub17cG0091000 [Reevesia pubescens]